MAVLERNVSLEKRDLEGAGERIAVDLNFRIRVDLSAFAHIYHALAAELVAVLNDIAGGDFERAELFGKLEIHFILAVVVRNLYADGTAVYKHVDVYFPFS